MIHLRVYRPIFFENFKNNITRAFCSKSSGEGDSASPAEPSIETQTKNEQTGKNEDITNKINSILKSMISESAKAKETPKPKLPVDDYGFEPKKRKSAKSEFEVAVKEIKDAAASVAKSLGNDPEIEKQLVSKALEEVPQISNLNWSQLIDGMQIDNSRNTEEYVTMSSRSQQVKSAISQHTRDPRSSYVPRSGQSSFTSRYKVQSIDLFSGNPIGIFGKDFTGTSGVDLTTWDDLEKYEKTIATTYPPENYLQKMIQWTKQGKIWKFPIDNEQGLDQEQTVHFSEHIFLDGNLEGWCPSRGPIRHFMELVCVGLSKNPHITVKDKREHILWYRDYFESKRDLLEQIGAYGDNVEIISPTKEL